MNEQLYRKKGTKEEYIYIPSLSDRETIVLRPRFSDSFSQRALPSEMFQQDWEKVEEPKAEYPV